MDQKIKKESVNPTDDDIKNISEQQSTKIVKKQIVDDRTDNFYIGSKVVGKNNELFRRPTYPWEDESALNKSETEENLKIIKKNNDKNGKEEKYTVESKKKVES